MLKRPSGFMLFFAGPLIVLLGGICQLTGTFFEDTSNDLQITPASQAESRIIPQRLRVTYWGQDGSTFIGSGCPGNDGKGQLVDYHFTVSGVDSSRNVTRIVAAGNNSTVTWADPCSNTWGLYAIDNGGGRWDIYVAPSEPTDIYTILFFYGDNSFALGMAEVPAN